MYVYVLKIEMHFLAEDKIEESIYQLSRTKPHSIPLGIARGKLSVQPSPLYFAKTFSCTIIVLRVPSLD